MKQLDIQARLEYARAAVGVLRTLKLLNQTMRYAQFATAIGLIDDDGKWEPWHQQQVRDILALTAATLNSKWASPSGTGLQPLEFERIVGADGKPGAGFHKNSRVVTE